MGKISCRPFLNSSLISTKKDTLEQIFIASFFQLLHIIQLDVFVGLLFC